MCLGNGLKIDFYPNHSMGNGLIEIVEIKANGEEKPYTYHLCSNKDAQEFIRNVREKRRSFLIAQDTGTKSFELLVDGDRHVTFRYPEWNTIKEMETRLLSVQCKVKFSLLSGENLRELVEKYVDTEFNRLFGVEETLLRERDIAKDSIFDSYFKDLDKEENLQEDIYDFLTLEEWMYQKNLINGCEK
ncbi:hypothetical protein [Bacillus cereus]|uniref:hypothetical protein n=1 Tax=Bacillus cereus TaxID=1396 RepID=UPI00240649DA|nr:hypothetical protein [Bacillus cereus]MDF9530121.1 hypothetical protein [Bacillus cereus]MDG1578473.1 hypothetical protein [Bacillus cereus]